jgi:hypothetical protein
MATSLCTQVTARDPSPTAKPTPFVEPESAWAIGALVDFGLRRDEPQPNQLGTISTTRILTIVIPGKIIA